MQICSKCGASNGAQGKFCSACGALLTADPDPVLEQTLSGLMTEVFEGAHGTAGAVLALDLLQQGEAFATRYEIDSLIGQGGMGAIYRARDTLTGDTVALKLIRADRAGNSAAVERLIEETLITRKIQHDNIVSVYDIAAFEGQLYMSMEWLDGISLREWIARQSRAGEEMAFPVVRKIVLELLDGLRVAHAKGVIHRDLKPENIILLTEPTEEQVSLKILDFGIARSAGSEAGSRSHNPLGTPRYMAPEQVTDPEAAGPQADLYSLSVMFYELLVGVLPQGHWQPPSQGRSDVPEGIDELIRTGLSNRIKARPKDVAAYLAGLNEANGSNVATSTQGKALTPRSPSPPPPGRIAEPYLGAPPAGLTPKVRQYWQKAQRGDAEALVNLGWNYETGRGGLVKDEKEAVRLYKLAADQGHARGQNNLGAMYLTRRGGLPKDDGEAARLFKLAADQGNARSKSNLGSMYLEGRGGLPKDDGEAVRFFKLAADQGDAYGQVNLGYMYVTGLGGLAKDEREAARLYKLAADQGDAAGQYNLGVMYRDGLGGLAKDEREAARLYKLAADQGDASGQYNLGVMYRDGLGVLAKDDREAVRLFKLAADQGHARAQCGLGVMYHHGRGGLPIDDSEAVRLYKLAAQQGEVWAQSKLKKLGQTW